ncbi:MAG: response regulator [archaeon]
MTPTIMIVDDEPHIVKLEKAILQVEGYQIITAHNGEEAIKKLETEKPDLIILDMMMPGMSGRETCDKIRKNPMTKKYKVIFVTVAKFSEVGMVNLKDMNVIDYITKPFDNDDFVKRVKKALEK